jgi:hypothetical protein
LERFKRVLISFIRNATRRMDYLALYPATVLKDHGNHELDLRPDQVELPALVRVPLRLGIPGATVKVKAGARVLLGFDNGDPDKPTCQLWSTGTLELLKISTGQGHVVTIDDDRGQASGDNVYALPKVTVKDKAGNTITLDATPGAEKLELLDKGGSKITLDPVTTHITVSAIGDVNVTAAGKVNLAGGGAAVARVGDPVVNGAISAGSTKVFSG